MTLRAYARTFLFVSVALSVAFAAMAADEPQAGMDSMATAEGAYHITAIRTDQVGNDFVIRVHGSEPPTYTMYELYEPSRIIVDVADASLDKALTFPMVLEAGPVSSIGGSVMADLEPVIARLEIFLNGDNRYSVDRDKNDIILTIMQEERTRPTVRAAEADDEKEAKALADSPVAAIIENHARPAATSDQNSSPRKAAEPAANVPAASQDNAAFAGYRREPITVDFYKIDIHNVFRLIGEISGMNIVVDQGVTGTLTLALQNVPWDFVLDIILNLKSLQKEERFNTLVISNKGTEFKWPKRKEEKLDFKSDGTAETFEALTVKKQQEVSREELEAKKLMMQARKAEDSEVFGEAFALYEQAFALWPTGDLANRLAALYLVQGMNAKAVYYGKEALKKDAQDRSAALCAAIGLANMNRTQAAKEYFDLAVSGPQPAEDALYSYAVFAEENESYVAALLLLATHEELYGDTMETMIARARIYDKEGNAAKAAEEYRAILLSGFELPSDLSRYIKGRLALDEMQE